MSVTQNYPVELGHATWHINQPTVPQSGTVITNPGLAVVNQSASAKATINAVLTMPHQPPSWKVR